MKHHPSPTAAMIIPPMDGPMMRLRVHHRRVERDRVGEVGAVLDHLDDERLARRRVERVDASPARPAEPGSRATVITPANASTASASDCSIDSTCVTTSTRCRFHRSTSTPANGASMSVGIWPQKPTTPSRNAEPVSR